MRMGLGELGPQGIAFWRFLFALPFLLALVVITKKRLPQKPNKIVLLAGALFSANIAFWHWSLAMTSVANATFIVSLGNLGVGFLAWAFLKEKPGNIWFGAIIIALLGAGALSLGSSATGAGNLRGDLLAIVAACCVSGYILCSKIARREISGLDAIFWLTAMECFCAVFWVGLSGESYLPKTLGGLWIPFLLAICVQIGGQGLIIIGLGQTQASIAGVLIVVQPVVAAAAAWALFQEHLTVWQFAGCLLILLAIWLAQKSRVKPAAP